MSRNRNEREKRVTNLEAWVPKTRLGKMIQEGKITSIEEVFLSGLKISESQIVDSLIPDLQEEVINVNLVQHQNQAYSNGNRGCSDAQSTYIAGYLRVDVTYCYAQSHC